MGMHSSWNSDRIAANCMGNRRSYKRRKELDNRNSITNNFKASELYIKEYGLKAYQNWLIREEKINSLMNSKEYSKYEICKLREKSFRQMKAEGIRA